MNQTSKKNYEMKSSNMNNFAAELFHGNNLKKNIGQIEQFEKTTGFYNPVWSREGDSVRISPEFGSPLSNLLLRALFHREVHLLGLRNFGKNRQILSGKRIMNKANNTLKECKKYQAFWEEFMVNGSFLSGKDETDCVRYVLFIWKK
jgi:hypothetical protein